MAGAAEMAAQTCNPTATFTYTNEDGEEVTEQLESYSGSAPVKAEFNANPTDVEDFLARYEWIIYETGNEQNIIVHRFDEDIEYTFLKHGSFTVELKATFVADGDSVSVDSILDRYENTVELKGAVFRAGKYQLGGNITTVRSLLDAAEGVTEEAFLNRAVMHRMKSDRTLEALDWNRQIVTRKIQNDVRALAYRTLIVQKKVDFQRQLVSISEAAENRAREALNSGSVEITKLNFIQLQNQTRQAKLSLEQNLNDDRRAK